MSSAVCWKWIFSVEENRNKYLPKIHITTQGTFSTRGFGGGRSVLTISRGMDDQELLVLQRGHSVCQLGHLRGGGQEDRVSCGAMAREQVGAGDINGGVKVGNARPWRAGLPIS